MHLRWQCIAAVPSVFNVSTPSGLEEWSKWIDLLEFPNDFGVELFVPSACFGSYRNRLLISSLWPIVLIVVAATGCVAWGLAQDRRKKNSMLLAPRGERAAMHAGLQRILPLTLIMTFILVPSTSTRIFKTFLCVPFEFDHAANEKRRYLHDDLSLSCSSAEYDATWNIAFVMSFIWPVGVPLMYATLLWVNRDSFITRISTPMTRATAFLWEDYDAAVFWWEPLEMCRKLALTGVRPAKRQDDGIAVHVAFSSDPCIRRRLDSFDR